MPTPPPKQCRTIVGAPLALLLSLTLISCGAPISHSPEGAGKTPTKTSTEHSQQSSTPPKDKTTSASPTGAVSAHLPPRDPEVLADTETARHSTAGDKRILTLDRAGALSRMVWSLGLGKNLVGRDTASDFPGVAELPQVTPGGHSINAETVLALRPDIVLTDGTIGPSRVVQKLRDAGVRVVTVNAERTPETIHTLIDDVASALGLEDQAANAKNHVAKQLEKATHKAQSHADGRKMMVLYLRGTGVAMIAGPDSGGRSLINRLGGTDAGEKLGISGTFTPLTPEALTSAAPDTLIVMRGGLESVGGVDGLLDIPGVKQTPAGRNRSVLDVPDSQLLSFGTDTPRVIAAMAEALYG